MHAYLLIGNKGLNDKISALTGKNADIIINPVSKIDDVRQLKDLAKLRSDKQRYFLMKDFQLATAEAMNAFLKLLEEPGKNTNFILCVDSQKNVLDTITSRCEVVRLGFNPDETSYKVTKKFLEDDVSEKLQILHKLNAKDDTLDFLQTMISGGHQLIVRNEGNIADLQKFIQSAISSKTAIEQNANTTIALTKFTLDLVRPT